MYYQTSRLSFSGIDYKRGCELVNFQLIRSRLYGQSPRVSYCSRSCPRAVIRCSFLIRHLRAWYGVVRFASSPLPFISIPGSPASFVSQQAWFLHSFQATQLRSFRSSLAALLSRPPMARSFVRSSLRTDHSGDTLSQLSVKAGRLSASSSPVMVCVPPLRCGNTYPARFLERRLAPTPISDIILALRAVRKR